MLERGLGKSGSASPQLCWRPDLKSLEDPYKTPWSIRYGPISYLMKLCVCAFCFCFLFFRNLQKYMYVMLTGTKYPNTYLHFGNGLHQWKMVIRGGHMIDGGCISIESQKTQVLDLGKSLYFFRPPYFMWKSRNMAWKFP